MRGREIECGVLEGEDGSLIASLPGEIVPSNRHGFYTYEAKYLDDEGAAIKVPADLPHAVSDRVRKLSIEAFRALGCEGMARVDFFLREDGGLVVNEVNTLPGFTNISMYPKVMEAIGVGYRSSSIASSAMHSRALVQGRRRLKGLQPPRRGAPPAPACRRRPRLASLRNGHVEHAS